MLHFNRKPVIWKLLVVSVVLIGTSSGTAITADDGSTCREQRASGQCPSGMNEVYHDIEDSKMCCYADTKAERYETARAVRCRPSKCIETDNGYHGDHFGGEDFCSSARYLPPRVMNNRELEYGNFMEEKCRSTRGAKDGVVALCCPKESIDSYLVSTYGAEPNEFPHMAKLTTPGTCGATVYNKRYIITAAHCVVDDYDGYVKPKEGITVTLATSSSSDMDKESFTYKVERIIPHKSYSKLKDNPEYSKGYVREFNDIALLKLDRDIEFGDSVKALEIAPKDFIPDQYAHEAIVLGWGRL